MSAVVFGLGLGQSVSRCTQRAFFELQTTSRGSSPLRIKGTGVCVKFLFCVMGGGAISMWRGFQCEGHL